MREWETERHLFQPPRYTHGGAWFDTEDAARPAGGGHWDAAAVLSIASLGYAAGERTLLREVRRQPWLSRIADDSNVERVSPPPHGLVWSSPEAIAQRLATLLEDEIAAACHGRERLYVLLSGGLDSRIVAGVLARLRAQGRVVAKPVGITWGLEDSRDVLYAEAVARRLDMDWRHLPLTAADLRANIDLAASHCGALVSPVHLHRMGWFSSVEPDALVLAGSYGDSVGRGEFSGNSVLELRPLDALLDSGLLRPEVAPAALRDVRADLAALRVRANDPRPYAQLECEQQAQYMRGMIAHVMSVINRWTRLYQAFTAPQVYGYMWSLHPSARVDETYTHLLRLLGHDLVAIPWARTNVPVDASARPLVQHRHARGEYHEYVRWLRRDLGEELRAAVDPAYFADTGVFSAPAIAHLRDVVVPGHADDSRAARPSAYLMAWLWSLRRWAEEAKPARCLPPPAHETAGSAAPRPAGRGPQANLRRALAQIHTLHQTASRVRRWWLRRDALRRYPPQRDR